MTKTYTRHDIYEQLYGEIMTLQRKPGSTLRENALCEEFGVSRTPIRSVLQELRIAGLIEKGYAPGHILMCGDAPGDKAAAKRGERAMLPSDMIKEL